MTSNLSSPSYTETHWRIFDASTGEILASETIWTDEGADEYEPGPSEQLIRQFDRLVEVDNIRADDPPAADERVDIPGRALVRDPAPAAQEVVRPATLSGP